MSKKPFYLSLNRQELDLLADASYEEVTLYVTILKRLANFKTGLIGTFQKEPLTYEHLAQELSRPSTQGKPAVAISRDRARDLVLRLQERGLVSDAQVLGNSLVMLLPLSPIDYQTGNASASATDSKPAQGEKRRRKATAENPATPDVASLEDPFALPLSVLVNTDQSNNPFDPSPILSEPRHAADSNEWAEADDPFAQPVGEVIGEFFADDNTEGALPASIAGGDIHPLVLEGSPPPGAPLTVPEIARILAQGGMLYADSEMSHGLYGRWLRNGITRDQLLDAMAATSADMAQRQTPHSVDTKLRGMASGASEGGRGKVAL